MDLHKKILELLNQRGYSWTKMFYPEELILDVAVREVTKLLHNKLNKVRQKVGFSDGVIGPEDIEQAVRMGVAKALENYDVQHSICAKRTKFTSYAYIWVTKYLGLLDRSLDYVFVDEKGEIYTSLEGLKKGNGRNCKIMTTKVKTYLSRFEDEDGDVYVNDDRYAIYRRKRKK